MLCYNSIVYFNLGFPHIFSIDRQRKSEKGKEKKEKKRKEEKRREEKRRERERERQRCCLASTR
jgi:hypothetical protein